MNEYHVVVAAHRERGMIKVPLYGRCRVPESWVVERQERALLRVFRDPEVNPAASVYRTSFTASGGESVTSRAVSEVTAALSALFPK